MNISLEFLPDVIVFFVNGHTFPDGSSAVDREEIWGDEKFYENVRIFFWEKTKNIKSGFLFIKKGSLEYHIETGMIYN